MFWKIKLRETFGGQGSGDFGHAGRPGEVGGSGEGSGNKGAEKASGKLNSRKPISIDKIFNDAGNGWIAPNGNIIPTAITKSGYDMHDFDASNILKSVGIIRNQLASEELIKLTGVVRIVTGSDKNGKITEVGVKISRDITNPQLSSLREVAKIAREYEIPLTWDIKNKDTWTSGTGINGLIDALNK